MAPFTLQGGGRLTCEMRGLIGHPLAVLIVTAREVCAAGRSLDCLARPEPETNSAVTAVARVLARFRVPGNFQFELRPTRLVVQVWPLCRWSRAAI
jgi:hypothetical protein